MQSECIAFLKSPAAFCQHADNACWSRFIQEARQYALLGTCYFIAREQNLWDLIPSQVQAHLTSGYHYAEKQKITLLHEMLALEKVFTDGAFPVLVVKGTAYRLAGYQFARGRVFSDIDLLVPPEHFKQALHVLNNAGYLEMAMSAYDRRYYLRWSHQSPPLMHFLRGANIDLHHHIFPVASREDIRVESMISTALPLKNSAFSTPAPAYLFMHAAVHLFYQDETHKLIKDLCDLYQMYLEIIKQEPVQQIIDAAQASQAQAAVLYALQSLQLIFGIRLPEEAAQLLPFASRYRQWQMRFLLSHLLDKTSFWHRPAHLAWVIRGHLLKMGPFTLLYHAVAKTLEQLKDRRTLGQKQRELDAQSRPGDAH